MVDTLQSNGLLSKPDTSLPQFIHSCSFISNNLFYINNDLIVFDS